MAMVSDQQSKMFITKLKFLSVLNLQDQQYLQSKVINSENNEQLINGYMHNEIHNYRK